MLTADQKSIIAAAEARFNAMTEIDHTITNHTAQLALCQSSLDRHIILGTYHEACFADFIRDARSQMHYHITFLQTLHLSEHRDNEYLPSWDKLQGLFDKYVVS